MKRVLTIRMGSLLTALAILFSLFPIPVAAVEAGWIDQAQNARGLCRRRLDGYYQLRRGAGVACKKQ